MRMRFKPYAHDELMAADFHVHEPCLLYTSDAADDETCV